MKLVYFLLLLVLLVGCATPRPHVYQLPPALSEVFRGGQLKGLETPTTGDPNLYPNSYDMVQHVCVSKPIWGLRGEYIRTDVACW